MTGAEAAWSWRSWLRLGLCVAAPLAVSLIAIVVFRATNNPFDVGLGAAGGEAAGFLDPQSEGYWERLAAERRARLLWETSIVALIVASLAAAAISIWIITASLAGAARRNLLVCLLGLVAAMVLFIIRSDVSFEFTKLPVLEPTVGKVLELTEGGFSLERFELSRKITNSLSTAATVAIVFAMVAATQLSPAPVTGADFEERVRHAAAQAHRLHILLYAAAAVLITVVLSMAAWLLWPVALAGTTAFQGRLLDIAAGIGLFWGTTFTLILAASYLPSAIWLNARIRELRMAPGDPQGEQAASVSANQGTDEVLARFGLGQNVFSQVTQLVAILSPMISGALPFLGTLTQTLG